MALAHRSFRLLWIGQVTRGLAMWLQLVAVPLLALSLGATPLDLGIIAALQFLPVLFLAPIGGVYADGLPKRRALVGAQILATVQLTLFVLLLAADAVALPFLFANAALLGLINAVEMPTRISFTAELVPAVHLSNAVALQMSAFNITRVGGPVVAGFMVASVGYLLTFATALVVTGTTVVIFNRISVVETAAETRMSARVVSASLWAGFEYVARSRTAAIPLLLLATMAVFGISFQAIAPLYATQQLALDEAGFGLFMGALGMGALLGVLLMTLASLQMARRMMHLSPAIFGLVLVALAVTHSRLAGFALVVLLGFTFLLTNTSVNMTLQAVVPHVLRGRLMGVYVSIAHGGMALGGILLGTITQASSVQLAMAVSGAAMVALAVVTIWLSRRGDSVNPTAGDNG